MKNRITGWVLGGALLASAAGSLQDARAQDRDRDHRRDDGFRQGYSQARPYDDRYDRARYGNDDDRYRREHGGIGPGKGALIGGAGGAALGALFGGGLKGALIGGGIGAGGGALIGKAAQNNRDNRDYRERYDRDGRRY